MEIQSIPVISALDLAALLYNVVLITKLLAVTFVNIMALIMLITDPNLCNAKMILDPFCAHSKAITVVMCSAPPSPLTLWI